MAEVNRQRGNCGLDAEGGGKEVSRMPDQLLPQPPPDAPAPPPSEEALQSRRKMGCMIWIGGSAMFLCLLLLLLPMAISSRKPPSHVEAVNNARQIGLALFKFESEYGKFPDSTTAAAVRLKTGSTLTLSDHTSNDLFAQLLASGIALKEQDFYANAKSAHKPDNVFATDATILEHGECAFAYISGLSASDNPSTPLAFGPVIPGTATLDRKTCDGKAIVLRLDNSATAHHITSSGKILISGLDLLDPRQLFWNGKTPDVKWPE